MLISPTGESSWGDQRDLESIIEALESTHMKAMTHDEDQLKEAETNEMEKVFHEEFMALRAQFEKVRFAQSGNLSNKVVPHQAPPTLVSIRATMNAVSTDLLNENCEKKVEKVSSLYSESSEEEDPFEYELPAEFLEVIDRMMATEL